MEDCGRAGLGTGLDIRTRAHDHARHGKHAQRTADHVAHALRAEFAIVLGACAAVHLVDGGGAQERLGTCDEGNRKRADQDRRLDDAKVVLEARKNGDRPDVVGDVDVLDLIEVEDGCGDHRRDHADKRAGIMLSDFGRMHSSSKSRRW